MSISTVRSRAVAAVTIALLAGGGATTALAAPGDAPTPPGATAIIPTPHATGPTPTGPLPVAGTSTRTQHGDPTAGALPVGAPQGQILLWARNRQTTTWVPLRVGYTKGTSKKHAWGLSKACLIHHACNRALLGSALRVGRFMPDTLRADAQGNASWAYDAVVTNRTGSGTPNATLRVVVGNTPNAATSGWSMGVITAYCTSGGPNPTHCPDWLNTATPSAPTD